MSKSIPYLIFSKSTIDSYQTFFIISTIMNTHRFRCFLAFLFSTVFAAYTQAETVKLGEIRDKWAVKAKTLSVVSSDVKIQQMAQRAFDIHGAFAVKDSGGQFTVRLTPETEAFIKLEILSGTPASVSFSQSVRGSDKENATLKACDVAVMKITGEPGFFAGKIAFVSDRNGGSREIYESDLFLQKARRITNHNSNSLSPHLSPDGSKITYTSYFNTGFPDLFIYDATAGRISKLASFDGTNTGGVFDPTGNRMIMVLSSSGNPELYVANGSGQNPKRITTNRSLETSPSWSGDGKRIVFTSDQGGSPQIFEMDVADGSSSRLSTNISHYCSEADWNPLYPELVVFTAANSKGFQLAIFNRSTREARWLTDGGGDNIEARWMNDGRHIIFTQRASKSTRLHVMDVESKKISPLHSSKFGNSSQASFAYPR